MRVLRAARLIAEGARVAEAARAVGYDDNHAFRSAFCRWTGRLPSKHAQQTRAAGKERPATGPSATVP